MAKSAPKYPGVYTITNTVNGKVYVGQSHDVSFRRRRHFAELQRGGHCNEHLQRAWTMYGAESFVFRVVVICEKEELERIEQEILDRVPADRRYNICVIRASSTRGIKHSAATRLNMSLCKRGNRNPSWGTKHSEEHKRKIGAKSKGNKYRLGCRDSAESRAKKSKSQTIRYQSPEAREQSRQYALMRWNKREV